MVSKQSNRGLIEWIWQRISAIVIVVYAFVILSYLFGAGESASYIDWLQFYSQTHVRVLTLLATAAVLWHGWIGIWTVLTDYVKLGCLRKLLEILVLLFLAVCGLWMVILMCG